MISLSVVAAATLLAGLASLAAQTVSVELVRTFDYTVASGYIFAGTGQINDRGVFVLLVSEDLTLAGALGFPDGNFSQPFFGPNASKFTVPLGINNRGLVCGTYEETTGLFHGFFGSQSILKTYDPKIRNVTSTLVESVNTAGNFAGTVQTGRFPSGFAMIDGALINILTKVQARASGINNLNQVVGSYADDDGIGVHGYLRATDGTLTMPLDFPGALETMPRAINDSGYIVGSWKVEGSSLDHAFIMKLPDTSVSYDVPGAIVTVISGLNNSGQIVGYYQDPQFITHGFLAQLVEQ